MVSQTHLQLICELTAEMQVQQSQSQVQLPGSLLTILILIAQPQQML